MQIAVLNSDSKKDLKLVLDLAKRIGIKAKLLSDSEIREIGLTNSIKSGRTGEDINTSSFVKKLRK